MYVRNYVGCVGKMMTPICGGVMNIYMYVCMYVCNYVGSVANMVTSICGGVVNIYMYVCIHIFTPYHTFDPVPVSVGF